MFWLVVVGYGPIWFKIGMNKRLDPKNNHVKVFF
jgi:streptogramin lyase